MRSNVPNIAIVGYALGTIAAVAGLTTIPLPAKYVFVGLAVLAIVLRLLHKDELNIKVFVFILAYVTGVFLTANYFLPS